VSAPRVSVLIPAYNAQFFPAAFASARAQAYADLEIVVCDDSPGEAIESVVRAAADPRVRYLRNPERRGFEGNFTECFRQARGELVKFLNDDDLLMPQCVGSLVAAMDFDPRVTLATSRRRVIDAGGQPVQGHLASAPLAHVPCVVPGVSLGDYVLVNSMNFIGEPSTAMFRARDLPLEGGLFTWAGRSYHCLADLGLWLRLLARGNAFYQSAALSAYRVHGGQQQADEAMDEACIAERAALAHEARRHGFLADEGNYRAALARVRAIAAQWLQQHPQASATRERIAEVERELGARIS
jgi:glycosyltransferase involved in cell wall biosynthesis